MKDMNIREIFSEYRRAVWQNTAAGGQKLEENHLADRYYQAAMTEADRLTLTAEGRSTAVLQVIRHLREDADGNGSPLQADTTELEEKLLLQRFSFSRTIGGRQAGYRELLRLASGRSPEKSEALQLLREEQRQLINAGFTELVNARNRFARKGGYRDFWHWKHRYLDPVFLRKWEEFFSGLIPLLSRMQPAEHLPEIQDGKGKTISEVQGRFFGILKEGGMELPDFRIEWDFSPEYQGPPVALLLEAPDKHGTGAVVGLRLPFAPDAQLDEAHQELLYHELTHVLHFAGVKMPSLIFSDETLAPDALLYESQALALSRFASKFFLASRRNSAVRQEVDRLKLKDLLLVGWSERRLYGEADDAWTPERLSAAVERWERELYQEGEAPRLPLGASHLIRGELAGSYAAYPAAFWYSLVLEESMRTGKLQLDLFPQIWKYGNAAEYSAVFGEIFLLSEPLPEVITG